MIVSCLQVDLAGVCQKQDVECVGLRCVKAANVSLHRISASQLDL